MKMDTENKRQKPGKFSLHICDYCDKPLSRRDKLVNHIKNQHPGRPIPVSPAKEKSILKSVTPNKISPPVSKPRRSAQCMFCSKVLSRADKLDYHVRNIHFKNGQLDEAVLDKYIQELKEKSKKSGNSTPSTPSRTTPSTPSTPGTPTSTKPGTPSSTKPGTPSSTKPGTPTNSPARFNPTPCPYCHKIFSRKDSIYPHINSVHPEKKMPTAITITSAKNKKPAASNDNKSVRTEKVVVKKAPKEKEKKEPERKAEKKTGGTDWKKVWTSGNPVFVKFKFTRPKKRKRTISEISIDLESIEFPVASPSQDKKLAQAKKSTVDINENSERKKAKSAGKKTNVDSKVDKTLVLNGEGDKSLKKGTKAAGKSADKVKISLAVNGIKASEPKKKTGPSSSANSVPSTPTVRLDSQYLSVSSGSQSSPAIPNLIEQHRRSIEASFSRTPVSPPKKKIQILESITYK